MGAAEGFARWPGKSAARGRGEGADGHDFARAELHAHRDLFPLRGLCPGPLGPQRRDRVFAPGTGRRSARRFRRRAVVGHRLMESGRIRTRARAYSAPPATRGSRPTCSRRSAGQSPAGPARAGRAAACAAPSRKRPTPPAWNNLGVVLMEKGDTGEAADDLPPRLRARTDGASDRFATICVCPRPTRKSRRCAERTRYKVVRRGAGNVPDPAHTLTRQSSKRTHQMRHSRFSPRCA